MRTNSKTCVAPTFACLEFVSQNILKMLKIKLELTLNPFGNILIISRVSKVFHPLCIWVSQLPITVMISLILFLNIFVLPVKQIILIYHSIFSSKTVLLSSSQTTYGKVVSHLKKLKSKNTFGPDKIPSKILKEYMSVIAEPLCLIFNKSLISGSIIKIWKT